MRLRDVAKHIGISAQLLSQWFRAAGINGQHNKDVLVIHYDRRLYTAPTSGCKRCPMTVYCEALMGTALPLLCEAPDEIQVLGAQVTIT